jgi:hypothetical protein
MSAYRFFSAFALFSAACSPVFDVEVAWTVDGNDPAGQCEFFPDGTVVRFSAVNHDKAEARYGGAVSETQTDFACGDGKGTLQLGSFAEVRAELVDGDTSIGTSSLLEVAPGAASNNYAADEGVTGFDIALTKGTLHATFLVLGESCGAAGADEFTVTLFENSEPRTLSKVDEKTVSCGEDGASADFKGLDIDARYLVSATTSAGGRTFSTESSGEGAEIAAANTFLTVDLQAVGE